MVGDTKSTCLSSSQYYVHMHKKGLSAIIVNRYQNHTGTKVMPPGKHTYIHKCT